MTGSYRIAAGLLALGAITATVWGTAVQAVVAAVLSVHMAVCSVSCAIQERGGP